MLRDPDDFLPRHLLFCRSIPPTWLFAVMVRMPLNSNAMYASPVVNSSFPLSAMIYTGAMNPVSIAPNPLQPEG